MDVLVHIAEQWWNLNLVLLIQGGIAFGLFCLLYYWIRNWPPRWRYGILLLVIVKWVIPWPVQFSIPALQSIPTVPVISMDSPTMEEEKDALQMTQPEVIHEAPVGNEIAVVQDYQPVIEKTQPEMEDSSAPVEKTVMPLPDQSGTGFIWTYKEILFLIWGLGCLGLLGFGFASYFLFWNLRKQAKEDLLCSETIQSVQGYAGLKRLPKVFVTPICHSPMVMGIWNPTILLSEDCAQRPLAELKMLILHELFHIKRNDPLVVWLLSGIRILFWWNPLLLSLIKMVRNEMEHCCDEAVMQHNPQLRKEYGHLILSVAETVTLNQTAQVLPAFSESKSALESRIRRIAMFNGEHKLKRTVLVSMIAVIALLVPGWALVEKGSEPVETEVSASADSDMPPLMTMPRGTNKIVKGILFKRFESGSYRFDIDLPGDEKGFVRAEQEEIGKLLQRITKPVGINYVILGDFHRTMTFSLYHPTMNEILKSVYKMEGCSYSILGNTLYLGTENAIQTFQDGLKRQELGFVLPRLWRPLCKEIDQYVVEKNPNLSALFKRLAPDLKFDIDEEPTLPVRCGIWADDVKDVLDDLLPAYSFAYFVDLENTVHIGKPLRVVKDSFDNWQAASEREVPKGATYDNYLDSAIGGVVEAKDIELHKLLYVLEKEPGIDTVLGEGIHFKVSFRLAYPSIRTLFDTILAGHDLEFRRIHNALYIDRAEKIDSIAAIQEKKFSTPETLAPNLNTTLWLEANDLALKPLLDVLYQKSGVRMIQMDGGHHRITCNLRNFRVKAYLDLLLPAMGLDYRAIRPDIVCVGKPGTIKNLDIEEVLERVNSVYPYANPALLMTPIGPSEETPVMIPALDKRILGTVEANKTDLVSMLIKLGKEGDVNFLKGRSVGGNVTFSLQTPTIKKVLDNMLPPLGLTYRETLKGIYIDTPDNVAAYPNGTGKILDLETNRVFKVPKVPTPIQIMNETSTFLPSANSKLLPEEEISAKLNKLIEGPVEAANIDINQILMMLQAESNLQFVMGPGIKTKVTFKLLNPTVKEVLDTVLPVYGLGYRIKYNRIVWIDTLDKLKSISKSDDTQIIPDSVPEEIADKLNKRIEGPVEANDVDINQILMILQSESQLQFVLGNEIKRRVTFRLVNPTIREVLDTVLPSNGLGYGINQKGVVLIDTIQKIQARVKRSEATQYSNRTMQMQYTLPDVETSFVVPKELPPMPDFARNNTIKYLRAKQLLDKRLDGVTEFKDMSIRTVISLLLGNNNIQVRLGPSAHGKISFRMINPTVREVLEMAVSMAGLEYYIINPTGVIEIDTHEDLNIKGPHRVPPFFSYSTALDKQIHGPVQARGVDLAQIIRILEAASGIKISMNDVDDPKVTFSLQNPTVREVLNTILPPLNLGYFENQVSASIVSLDFSKSRPEDLGIMTSSTMGTVDRAKTRTNQKIGESLELQDNQDNLPPLEKKVKGTLAVTDADAQTLLTALFDKAGLNYIISGMTNLKLRFKLENPAIKDILDYVLAPYDCQYAFYDANTLDPNQKAGKSILFLSRGRNTKTIESDVKARREELANYPSIQEILLEHISSKIFNSPYLVMEEFLGTLQMESGLDVIVGPALQKIEKIPVSYSFKNATLMDYFDAVFPEVDFMVLPNHALYVDVRDRVEMRRKNAVDSVGK